MVIVYRIGPRTFQSKRPDRAVAMIIHILDLHLQAV